MELLKIKYKSGVLQGKENKEGYFLRVGNKYMEIRILAEALFEFPNIIEEKLVTISDDGKIMEEKV